MKYRNIADEILSHQTAIDIAIEHNILPQLRPIISVIGCLTQNMSSLVDKIVQHILQKSPATSKAAPNS